MGKDVDCVANEVVDLFEGFSVIVQVKVTHRNGISTVHLFMPVQELLCLKKVAEYVVDFVGALVGFVKEKVRTATLKKIKASDVEV